MIKELSLWNFRNFSQSFFTFENGKNLVLGPNGSGKTNLLEAIGYISQGKSFRKTLDRDLILWGQNFFKIEAKVGKNGISYEIEVSYEKTTNEKKITVNKKLIERYSTLFSIFPSIISSDRDQDVIDGPPLERRKIINRLISIIHPNYLNLIFDYNKVLENKNALLKAKATHEISPWNQKQEQLTREISKLRRDFINEISEDFSQISCEFLNGRRASISYIPSLDEKDTINDFLSEELELGFSNHGVHRDNFEFFIEGKHARTFASEGEKRLTILSFYLAFLNHYKPDSLIILDEPFSVLDKRGIEVVLSHLRNQTFISAPYMDSYKENFQRIIEL